MIAARQFHEFNDVITFDLSRLRTHPRTKPLFTIAYLRWDSDDPNPTLPPLSFPDGDLLLRSRDGVDFRVYSQVLKIASSFFVNLSALPRSTANDSQQPLQMEETSQILNIILRLVHPIEIAPTSIASEQAQPLLRAVEKLDIKNHAVNALIDRHLDSIEPLRAWALAIRFKRDEARKVAVRKYLLDETEARPKRMKEFDDISGLALASIQSLKHEVLENIKETLSDLTWACPDHERSDWYSNHMAAIEASPFESALYSDQSLLNIMEAGEKCWKCRQRFHGKKATRSRSSIQPTIEMLLDKAVENSLLE